MVAVFLPYLSELINEGLPLPQLIIVSQRSLKQGYTDKVPFRRQPLNFQKFRQKLGYIILLLKNQRRRVQKLLACPSYSVADPHHVDADPDPAFHFDADPDPDPTFHSDADPPTLKKIPVPYSNMFHYYQQSPGSVKRLWIQSALSGVKDPVISTVLRIRDPVPFDPWIRDPGWVESQHPDPGSEMNNLVHIF
jgi:hypothetical protein